MGPSTFEKKIKQVVALLSLFHVSKRFNLSSVLSRNYKRPTKKIKEAQMISSVAMVAVTIWCTCRRF